jgi:transposase
MEASGHARWFERLLAELNIELWIGDASEIARIWVPSGENRDLRQLLWHRHRMGRRARAS